MTEEKTVLAHYTCTKCNVGPIDIAVPERINGTNVPTWLIRVIFPLCMEDHKKRSPQCDHQFLDVGLRPPDYQPEIVQ